MGNDSLFCLFQDKLHLTVIIRLKSTKQKMRKEENDLTNVYLFILGMVLANDANRKRCKAVVGNLHRWVGTKCSCLRLVD
jgi:hypothetical protein